MTEPVAAPAPFTPADNHRLHLEAYNHLMAFCATMKQIPDGKQHGGMRAIADEVRRNRTQYEGYAERLRNRLPGPVNLNPMSA